MSACGWCWVVLGRRILVWPWEQLGSSGPAAARELTLPQTDLAHKADLVTIFYEDDEQTMPSCVGASPEGIVRYWASVGQEGAYFEVSCELAGQECDRLVSRNDAAGSLLLATTTCTLVRITTSREGRPTVSCSTLGPPSGWLGGIGRRVSLLFFGSMPAHADTKLVGVVILPARAPSSGEEQDGELVCLLAGGPSLQTWGAALHEHHLRRPLLEAAARAHLVPHGGAAEASSLDVQLLDVQASADRELLLLLALSPMPPPADRRLALAFVDVSRAETPRVRRVCGVGVRSRDEAPRCVPLGGRALLYSHSTLALVRAGEAGGDAGERIDLTADADHVLGAAHAPPHALLFTRKHGLLRLRPADHDTCEAFAGSPAGSSSAPDVFDGNLTLYEIDPHEISATAGDVCGALKVAFLLHVRRDPGASRLLGETFPARAVDDVDAPLDRAVLAVAREMLDDVPSGDPRWRIVTGRSRIALGSSGALTAAGQLRDKRRVYSLYVDFLRATALWPRLGYVGKENGGGCVRTVRVLCALAERLAAAGALQQLHAAGAPLVDAAVQRLSAETEAEEEPEVAEALRAGALAAVDVLLRRVTRATRPLAAFALLPAPTSAHAAPHALAAAHAIASILGEMQKVRSQWGRWDEAAAADAEPSAELPVFLDFHTMTVSETVHNCRDAPLRSQLVEAAAALADLLLADAHALPHDAYRALRARVIRPYMEAGEWERAAALAEKFEAFELLVELCVRRPDPARLQDYLQRYERQGMAETAFAWLASRGGQERARMVRELGDRHDRRLTRWLQAAPARRPLLALHLLARAPPAAPAAVLLDMAHEERDSVNRMVTMSSLAKLCLAAGDEREATGGELWARAEALLSLGAQHLALPSDLRARHGFGEDMRRLDPEDLVALYAEADGALGEYDYKKALELLPLVDDAALRERLRLRLWSACLLRADYTRLATADPQLAVRDTPLYRLLELLILSGEDTEVPSLEALAEHDTRVRQLADHAQALYLLKYTYDCLLPQDADMGSALDASSE